MLDTYDMQMTDYYTDLDIQMHASSSDQWFQDEAKMEEDAPALKLGNSFILKTEGLLPMKTEPYAQEKSDATIEVDMEPVLNHQNAEYDMLDDEEIHGSGADFEDVEVYDASHRHSPAMGAIDTSQEGGSTFLGAFEGTATNDPLNYHLSPEPANFSQEQADPRELESDSIEGVSTSQEGESMLSAHVPRFVAESRTVTLVEPLDPSTAQKSEFQLKAPSDDLRVEEFPTAEVLQSETLTTEPIDSSHADSLETLHLVDETSHDTPDDNQRLAQPTTNFVPNAEDLLGDPHEISEGVYIDPPPPVMLSLSPEERFIFALFNEPLEWNPPRTLTGHLLLHQLPTLYYEPLSSVFEALRHEEVIESTFPLTEAELVLDAVDLQLSISEDNIYAREVSLHDLNVLHDVSGISGLLRVKLYTSTPRFIVQYQQLQAQVGQLNFEQPAGEVSEDGPTVAEEEESPEEKDQETIQGLPKAENHHRELSEPLLKTGHSTHGKSHDEEEHNDPLAEISHEEDFAPEPHEGTQNHESLSKIAKEIYDDGPSEIGEERPQDQYDENYEETYDENYEENPENHHTPGQVLSALPDVPQTVTNSHNASRSQPSEQDSHDGSPPNPPNPDLEGNVIALEVLEADSTDGGSVVEQVSNDSHQEETGSQLLQFDDKQDIYEENLEHSEETAIDVPENPETGSVAGNFERHGCSVVSEYNGEIAIPEPTFEDVSAIHLEGDLILESTEDPTAYGEDGWEDDPDGEGEIDETWDDDNENAHSNSNQSSITLSSKTSKRSFDEFESSGEGYDEEEGGHWSPPSSPNPKRSRTE